MSEFAAGFPPSPFSWHLMLVNPGVVGRGVGLHGLAVTPDHARTH